MYCLQLMFSSLVWLVIFQFKSVHWIRYYETRILFKSSSLAGLLYYHSGREKGIQLGGVKSQFHWHVRERDTFIARQEWSSSSLWDHPAGSTRVGLTALHVAFTDTVARMGEDLIIAGCAQSPDSPLGLLWHHCRGEQEGLLITTPQRGKSQIPTKASPAMPQRV